MIWWGWLVMGAILLGAELFLIDAQFYLFFIGLSAILVGLASMMGIPLPAYFEWLVFGGLSVFFMFTFRRTLYQKLRKGAKGYTATIHGDTVDIDIELGPGDETRAEYRGSVWTVRNTGETIIEAGSRVHVTKVDGVKLHVQ